jgi:transposase-like protein
MPRSSRLRNSPVQQRSLSLFPTARCSKCLRPSEAMPHITERYANNVVEADHGRLKAQLRPMRGLKRFASARTIFAGHAFVQNLRRGHYAITTDLPVHDRVRVAFDELLHHL